MGSQAPSFEWIRPRSTYVCTVFSLYIYLLWRFYIHKFIAQIQWIGKACHRLALFANPLMNVASYK